MKVAIVHEWLVSIGGSEKVVLALLELFPNADIFVLFKKKKTVYALGINPEKVFASSLNRLPFSDKIYQKLLPFFPLAVEQHDLREYDLVISSSHAVSKGVLTHVGQQHISYIHTPMRYAWDMYQDYIASKSFFSGFSNFLAKTVLHYLRIWDQSSAYRPNVMLCNSGFVAKRIRRIYNRRAEVIYPPVDTERFPLYTEKEDFYFTLSRLVSYKRVDLIVEAFRELSDRKLYIAGDGALKKVLEKKAPPNVKFLGFLPHEEMLSYMQRAKAFVFAALEDFGISPVEAQSCGTPVIAYGNGGALETVVNNRTGLFFTEQTSESLRKTILDFDSLELSPLEIHEHAQQFSKERFKRQIIGVLEAEHAKNIAVREDAE